MPPYKLIQLRDILIEHFNLEELQQLCFELSMRYEDLSGQTLSAKAQSMVEYLNHRGRINELLVLVQKERPTFVWNMVLTEPDSQPPFRGLQYYTENDAPIFFGRETLTQQLVEDLSLHRFLAVIGASGSGKSSVVRAGLVPAVQHGKVVYRGRRSNNWTIHVITPGDAPLKALAATLTRETESVTAMKTLLADMRADHESLGLWMYRETARQNTRLLLVVDQFEELFTQCNDLEERHCFIENLVQAVTIDGQAELSLVLVLRADFYAHALQFPQLVSLLENRQRIVEVMNQSELERAIIGPAAQSGWQFQPGLVEIILQDIGAWESRRPEPGALPLLSHALLETWRRREGHLMTLSGYVEAGRVKGAIAQTAEKVFAQADLNQKILIKRIFLELTELGIETYDTRRRILKSRLKIQVGERYLDEVLSKLTDPETRLVVTSREETDENIQAEVLEVAHEALIREWPRLRDWLDEDRDTLRLRRRMEERAKEWIRNGHDEGYLYSGIELARIEQWLLDHEIEKTSLEWSFIVASIEAKNKREAEEEERRLTAERLVMQEHRGRFLGRWIVIVTLLFVLAMSAVYWAVDAGNETSNAWATAEVALATSEFNAELAGTRTAEVEGLKKSVQASQLAEASRAELEDDPELALLLAMAGLAFKEQGDTDASFYHAALSPFRNTLRGPVHHVASAEFSPDGKTIFTSGVMEPVRIWSANGEELSVLNQPVMRSFLSPNGRNIVIIGQFSESVEIWSTSGKKLFSLEQRAASSVIFNRVGDRFITINNRIAYIWSMSGEEITALEGHSGEVVSAAFSPTGDLVATASSDQTARLWSPSGEELAIFEGHKGTVNSVSFSPSGDRLVTASADGTARLWSLEGEELAVLKGHGDAVASADFSPDGNLILTISFDHTGRIWSLEGEELTVLRGPSADITSGKFSPDGEKIATASNDGTVRIWSLVGVELLSLRGHVGTVNSLNFSPDGEYIVTAGCDELSEFSRCVDATARIWSLVGAESAAFSVHQQEVLSTSLSQDGKLIATIGVDGTVQIWTVSGKYLSSLALKGDQIHLAVFSPTDDLVATAGSDQTVRLWSLSAEELAILKGHGGSINSISFNPNGDRLVTASTDGTARVWSLSGKELAVLNGHDDAVTFADFSPDGMLIVTSSVDRSGRLWSLEGEELAILMGHYEPVCCAKFSPDGEKIVTASADDTARLWTIGGESLATVGNTGLGANINSIAISPDSKLITTGSSDSTARVWSLSGEQLAVLDGHKVSVTSVTFDPTGTAILTTGSDGTARLWAISGEELMVMKGNIGRINSAYFSPDGDNIITVDDDGLVRIWPSYLSTESKVSLAQHRLSRGFTEKECQQFFQREPGLCPRSVESLFTLFEN